MTDSFTVEDSMSTEIFAFSDDGFAEKILESDGALQEKAVGNGAWIRGEVAEASGILSARNLAHANAIAQPMHPKKTLYLRFGKRVLDVVFSGVALPIPAIADKVWSAAC